MTLEDKPQLIRNKMKELSQFISLYSTVRFVNLVFRNKIYFVIKKKEKFMH